MPRIAVGGFLHETNTFAPTKATYADFVHGGGWPAMAQDDLLKVMRNINVGLAGFIEAAEAEGWELVPTIACGASPSAHVTEDAYERIVKVIVDGIKAAGPLDAVYLDLHGAMVTEHLDDGEGEILRRVRNVIGNGSAAGGQPRPARQCDARNGGTCGRADRLPHLSACRHGRHRPRRRGTSRAVAADRRQKFAKAFRQLPFLIPISWQCTNDQPTKGIYQKLAALQDDSVPTLSFAPGFPAADFRDCGPSVFAYGRTQEDADAAADTMVNIIAGHENDFDGRIYTPDEGVQLAMELAKTASKPIIIADTQDNPGAGGDSDTTGMLRALVRNNAQRAAIGVIYDPASASGGACRRRRRHRHAVARRQVRHSG